LTDDYLCVFKLQAQDKRAGNRNGAAVVSQTSITHATHTVH